MHSDKLVPCDRHVRWSSNPVMAVRTLPSVRWRSRRVVCRVFFRHYIIHFGECFSQVFIKAIFFLSWRYCKMSVGSWVRVIDSSTVIPYLLGNFGHIGIIYYLFVVPHSHSGLEEQQNFSL
jgi:hypothetical protein